MRQEILEVRKDEELILPENIDYNSPSLSLSTEVKKKLLAVRPYTVGIDNGNSIVNYRLFVNEL